MVLGAWLCKVNVETIRWRRRTHTLDYNPKEGSNLYIVNKFVTPEDHGMPLVFSRLFPYVGERVNHITNDPTSSITTWNHCLNSPTNGPLCQQQAFKLCSTQNPNF